MTEGTARDWRKSRRSYSSGGCVEAATAPAGVVVRDTTDRGGPMLAFGARQWATFMSALKVER